MGEILSYDEWEDQKLKSKIDIVNNFLSIKNTSGENYIKKDWLIKNILGLTQEEFNNNEKLKNRIV